MNRFAIVHKKYAMPDIFREELLRQQKEADDKFSAEAAAYLRPMPNNPPHDELDAWSDIIHASCLIRDMSKERTISEHNVKWLAAYRKIGTK